MSNSTSMPGALDQRRRRRDDVADQRLDGDRPQREAALPRLDARELEDLLDHLGEPPALRPASARRTA